MHLVSNFKAIKKPFPKRQVKEYIQNGNHPDNDPDEPHHIAHIRAELQLCVHIYSS